MDQQVNRRVNHRKKYTFDPARLDGFLLEVPTPDEIKQLRLKHRAHRFQFAKLVGYHYATWSSWEEGKAKMPAVVWTTINLLMDVHPEMFIFRRPKV